MQDLYGGLALALVAFVLWSVRFRFCIVFVARCWFLFSRRMQLLKLVRCEGRNFMVGCSSCVCVCVCVCVNVVMARMVSMTKAFWCCVEFLLVICCA